MFRVDLHGKGYTDAPKTDYHANLFVTQLALLLQYLKWDHAHIAGFSMVCFLVIDGARSLSPEHALRVEESQRPSPQLCHILSLGRSY